MSESNAVKDNSWPLSAISKKLITAHAPVGHRVRQGMLSSACGQIPFAAEAVRFSHPVMCSQRLMIDICMRERAYAPSKKTNINHFFSTKTEIFSKYPIYI